MNKSSVTYLIMSVLSWLALCAVLFTVVGADGTGDRDIFLGLRWILAGILVCAVWACLGGLLFIARGLKLVPGWALDLWLFSWASALAALYLSDQPDSHWTVVVPILIPPLIASYVFALYQPSLRAYFSRPASTVAVWGVILALSLSMWPAVLLHLWEESSRSAQFEQAMKEQTAQKVERKRAENLVRLHSMPADASLPDWYGLLEPDSGVRQEALEALRKVEHLQGDVEEGLQFGIPRVMNLVPELDLKPTAELCRAAQSYLKQIAKRA